MYSDRLLGPNEQIMLATHPHAMMVAGPIVRGAVLFIVVLVAAVVLPGVIPTLPANTPVPVNTVVVWLPSVLGWLTLLAAAMLILNTIGAFLTWNSREYVLTNQRILRADGILNKRSTSIPLERINNLLLSQSVTGRIWNYGTLTILAGNDFATDVFHYVPDVVAFQRAVLTTQDTPRTNPAAPTQPQRFITPFDDGQRYRGG